MRLGTRWSVGASSPDRLPETVRDAVREIDAELLALASDSFDPATWRWTLTWLEGRPVVELDDGTVVTQDAAGIVVVTAPPST